MTVSSTSPAGALASSGSTMCPIPSRPGSPRPCRSAASSVAPLIPFSPASASMVDLRWWSSVATAGGCISPTGSTRPGTSSSIPTASKAGCSSSTPSPKEEWRSTHGFSSRWSRRSAVIRCGCRVVTPHPTRSASRDNRRTGGQADGMMTDYSWTALLALGAGHGINPAMGWLFAVALGFQRESRRAVWTSLGPLAAGHAIAIAGTLVVAGLVGLIVSPIALRWATAGLLIGLGLYRLIRSRHPRFGGMQVGARELTVWSFLIASAHGAGLMVLPLVMPSDRSPVAVHHISAGMIDLTAAEWSGIWATLVHTAGYLLVTGLIAVIVYEKVGVRFLRKAWLNLDLIWAMALVITGLGMALGT